MPEQAVQAAADLHWLATLLTGCPEIAADVTVQAIARVDEPDDFGSTWSRRIVIAEALAAVREELAASARRTALNRAQESALPPPSWSLGPETTKSDLERALLPIDVFPRVALLLLLFERVPLKDAAVLLDAEPDLVRKAQAAGVRDLTINLARMQGWKSMVAGSTNGTSGGQHV
jgi:DNA-directed RNA polymerase specialized sigma24 family protein